MSIGFALLTILEIFIVYLLVIGIFKEKKLIAFERDIAEIVRLFIKRIKRKRLRKQCLQQKQLHIVSTPWNDQTAA